MATRPIPFAATYAAIPSSIATERELNVMIRPHQLDFWEYEGTRAQLEAEGVIPPETEWPKGADSLRWEAGRFDYWLRRVRPDGVKGPMSIWVNGDCWRLRCEFKDTPDFASRCILQKKLELAKELHHHTPAGQREWETRWAAYWKASKDEAFQAFKALIPGLVPPKRGRKPKAANNAPSASA